MQTLDQLRAEDVVKLVAAYRDVLRSHRERMNQLNVYPVPDGDTGTNMALTLDSVVAEIEAQAPPAPDGTRDLAAVARAIGHGSLMGARGNSGVILSQILRGLAGVFASAVPATAGAPTKPAGAPATPAAAPTKAAGAPTKPAGAPTKPAGAPTKVAGARTTADAASEPAGSSAADPAAQGVIDGALVAEGLRRAREGAYQAVGNPVEGTILTVIRAASDAASAAGSVVGSSLAGVLEAAQAAAAAALEQTPEMLPALKAAGVVDSGGYGLVLLFDAALNVVEGRPLPAAPPSSLRAAGSAGSPASAGKPGAGSPTTAGKPSPRTPTNAGSPTSAPSAGSPLNPNPSPAGTAHSADAAQPWTPFGHAAAGKPDRAPPATGAIPEAGQPVRAVGDLRYEVMFLLEAPDDSIAAFRQVWAGVGDSIVVVGGDGLYNCHIHTDDIGAAVEAGLDAGRPRQIRVSDLWDQVEEERWVREAGPAGGVDEPVEPVACAVVAVCNGEGIRRIFHSLGVHLTVAGGQSMNPSTADILAAIKAAPADQVVVLPNNKNIIPVAQAAAGAALAAGKTVRVVPTVGIPEGFAALLEYDPEGNASDNAELMAASAARVVAGEVTIAVRDADSPVGPIRAGDWLGLSRSGIEVVAPGPADAAIGLLARLVNDAHHEIATIIAGEGAQAADTRRITEWLAERWPAVGVEVHSGGQPLYPYLLSIE